MIYDDDINKNNISADDVLEDTRNGQNNSKPQNMQTKLEADYERPAASAKRPGLGTLPKDHPAMDSRSDISEVYEESEEGIVYSPNNPGARQQMREAEKILRKEERDEQA